MLDNLFTELEVALEDPSIDMNESNTVGTSTIIPEGKYNIRLIGYIETGKHIQTFQGKPKPPMPHARFKWVIYNQDGSVAKEMLSFNTALSNFDSSKAKKAFELMKKHLPVVNGREFKHFAMALGQPMSALISLKKNNEKEFNNLEWSSLDKPMKFSPDDGSAYTIPPIQASDIVWLLWDNPTKAQWDSLYIEGTREDGTSKNFIQDEIKKATNFAGSKLDILLSGAIGLPMPDEVGTTPVSTSAPPAQVQPMPMQPA